MIPSDKSIYTLSCAAVIYDTQNGVSMAAIARISRRHNARRSCGRYYTNLYATPTSACAVQQAGRSCPPLCSAHPLPAGSPPAARRRPAAGVGGRCWVQPPCHTGPGDSRGYKTRHVSCLRLSVKPQGQPARAGDGSTPPAGLTPQTQTCPLVRGGPAPPADRRRAAEAADGRTSRPSTPPPGA